MEIEEVESYLSYENAEQRAKVKEFFTNPTGVDRSKKTFVFSTPSETGTSYFRLFEPMKALWKHYRDEANFIYTENIQPNHMKLADCIIMHRAGNLHSHFLSVSRMWPKTSVRPLIIHDVDDNEFNLPRTHPMAELWYASQKDKMSIQALKHSDCVTTTTEKLSRTFKRFNKDVQIFRNQFDWTLPQWNFDKAQLREEMTPEFGKDKVVIGWAGLTSHYEDIKRMHNIIKNIHDNHPETVFCLAGMALKDSQIEIEMVDGKPHFREKEVDNEMDTYRARVKNMYSDIDPDRIKIFDALPLEQYAKFYALFDISLAYIEHNAFNSCKSEIKVIESLHYDCVPIFSNYGGYKDFSDEIPKDIKQPHMAINIMSPRPWIDAISYWVKEIKNGTHVEKIANIRKHSDEEYDINSNIESRLLWLLDKTEEFEEDQINKTASYVDYYGD